MPFSINFCKPCLLHPSSPPQSSSTMKSFLRHYFSKKHSHIVQHIKGFNTVQKINSRKKSHSSYDMTILHADELNNTQLATRRRRKKKIPSWAKKAQLQLAIINQVYFQEKNPDDIFGHICLDDVFDMINSLQINSTSGTSMILSRRLL